MYAIRSQLGKLPGDVVAQSVYWQHPNGKKDRISHHDDCRPLIPEKEEWEYHATILDILKRYPSRVGSRRWLRKEIYQQLVTYAQEMNDAP